MKMNATTLHDAISQVCPVLSASVGDPIDRLTWSFIPAQGATQPQIDAGNNVIATIPVITKSLVPPADFIARWTNAEYLALEKKRRDDIAANNIGNAKNWDIVIGNDLIDMNKQKVQNLKADLVAGGVLTQARADVIFA